jgi:hypothetical protein
MNQRFNGVFDHTLQPHTTYFNNHLNIDNVVFIIVGLLKSWILRTFEMV